MKFTYETTDHYRMPETWDYIFNEMVENRWRLVSVVKVTKEEYRCFWEKPE